MWGSRAVRRGRSVKGLAAVISLLLAGCGGSQKDIASPVLSGAPAAQAPAGGPAGVDLGASATAPDSSNGASGTGEASASGPSSTPAALAAPGVAAGMSTAGGAKSAAGSARTSSATGPAAAPSSGAAGAAGPAAGSQGPGGGSSAAPGAPTAGGAAASGDLKASDVGVTPNSIKLGTIGAISGAMPGQFLPSIQAAQAYFNMVNEKGGINGRKVQLVVQDDGLDGTKNLAAAKRLVEDEKVFSVVAETSPAMDASGKYLNDQKVPAVGVTGALGNTPSQFRYIVPVLGAQSANAWTSVYADYGKQFGNRCGVIDLSVAISQQSGTGQEAACKQAGMEVPYHATVQVVQPDYTAEITRMRTANLDFLVSIMEVNSNIRMMQAMRRQNYIPNPILFTGYDDAITQTVPDVMEKSATATMGVTPIEPDWIASNPELTLMQDTVKKYFRDARKTAWTLYGWQGAMLFTDAATAVGPDLTREGLMNQLDSMKNYNFHNTAWPQNLKFGERSQFAKCTAFLTWKGDKWATVKGLDFCGKQVKY